MSRDVFSTFSVPLWDYSSLRFAWTPQGGRGAHLARQKLRFRDLQNHAPAEIGHVRLFEDQWLAARYEVGGCAHEHRTQSNPFSRFGPLYHTPPIR